MIEAGVGRQVEDAFGVIRGGVVHAASRDEMKRAVPSSFKRCAAKRTSAKRRKIRPRTGAEYSCDLRPGVGAELISGIPEALFERASDAVFFQ